VLTNHILVSGWPLSLAGTIKRYGMKRGAMTHGSKSHREHGSTGPGTTPGRTFPGLKMAGHMGAQRRKCRSLQVGCALAWSAVLQQSLLLLLVVDMPVTATAGAP
jgi:ribosomal protein L3